MNITNPQSPPGQPRPDGTSSATVEVQTERQKTALLYANCGITLVMAFLVATVLALVVTVEGAAVPRMALLWWLLLGALTLARGGLALRFRRAEARANATTLDPSLSRWRQAYVAGTLASALLWSSGVLLFAWNAHEGVRLFTGLVLAGLVAAGMPALAPVPAAFNAFAVPALAPLALIVLSQGRGILDTAFGLCAVAFLLVLLGTARRWQRSLDVAIRLGVEQQRLAQMIKVSEERYRQILHHSPAGIFHYDDQLRITFCNTRLAAILQVDRDRIIGRDTHSLSDQRLMPALRAALEGREGSYEGEYISTLTGMRLWVTMACTPYRGVDGTIEGGIAIVQDVSERRRTQEEIHQLAFFDPLTRLPNRRLLMDRLARALQTSARSGQHGALISLDLDQFKRINDSQGHDTGDRMLIEAGRRLARCVGARYTVARFGGDEFIVVLEELGHDQPAATARAEELAEQLRAALEAPYDLAEGEPLHYSSVSLGLTLFCGDAVSCEQLLKQADVALYQAKEAGRNTARFFNPAMQANIQRRTSLEASLRRGLEQGELQLHYQPQVDPLGMAIAAEALVRWQPPGAALRLPGEFIGLAEESGLILAIDRWVIESACAQLRAWENIAPLQYLRLSVNVNARLFHQAGFVEQVRQILARSGANPALLNLELTESVVLSDVDAVVGKMEQLSDLGISFSLDDFGQGYSSLSYLKRLPLHQIKIDKAFVQGLPYDASDAAIVRAILALGESLELNVVAEGVEAAAQREFLLAHGCHTFQGFLFCRPLALEPFERHVLAEQRKSRPSLHERERDAPRAAQA